MGARGDSVQILDYYEKFYNKIFFPELDKNKIEILLMLGDTFDRRKYTNHLTLYRAKKMLFDELAKRNIQTYVLEGNHDVAFKNTNEVNTGHLLLGEYKNITIISEPTTINIYGNDICMLPWICSDNIDRSLDEIAKTKANICMGHLEIAGFAMYQGMENNEGFSRKLFEKFDRVFSGHYHHKTSEENITYLGNPYQLTWQDYRDDRGFHFFDLKTYELEFIKNTYELFYKIVYDDKVDSIHDIDLKNLSIYSGVYVKVVVINKTNPYLFDKFLSKLYDENPIDVTIAEDFIDRTIMDHDDIDQSEDTMQIINKCVESIDNQSLDLKRLKITLQQIYVEALNED